MTKAFGFCANASGTADCANQDKLQFWLYLEHKTTGELRYFYSSSNNANMLDNLRSAATTRHLAHFYSDNLDVDIRERERAREDPAPSGDSST